MMIDFTAAMDLISKSRDTGLDPEEVNDLHSFVAKIWSDRSNLLHQAESARNGLDHAIEVAATLQQP